MTAFKRTAAAVPVMGRVPETAAVGRAAPVAPGRVRLARVMSTKETIAFAVLLGAALLLTARYALWWFGADHLPGNTTAGGWRFWVFNLAPFAALTLVEGGRILQTLILWMFAAIMRDAVPMAPATGLRVAVLTAIVPSKEPLDMAEETLRAMTRIRYDGQVDVWLLDEENDPRVKQMCARLGVNHFSRAGIERFNQASGPFKSRTKAGNHNAWRDCHEAAYDVVAQMDLDHIPLPDFLEKTLGYFGDPDVAFVVLPQVYYRNARSNWIARGADEQNFGFSAVTQRGANTLGMPILIGSNHLVRPAAMAQWGGYASHIVEDHLTGMVAYTHHNPRTGNRWKGVYSSAIVSLGEGPATWGAYLSQQTRWCYGLLEIIKRDTFRLILRMRPKQAFGYVLVQSYYGTVALVYGLGVGLTALRLFFGIDAVGMDVTSWLSVWVPQILITMVLWYWLQRFYLEEGDHGLAWKGLVVGVGATLAYLPALVASAVGRKLPYVITPKGETVGREPLRLFRWHLASFALSGGALAFSLITQNGGWGVRGWAFVNMALMAIIIWSGAFRGVARREALVPAYVVLKGRSRRGVAYGLRVAAPVSALAVVATVLAVGFIRTNVNVNAAGDDAREQSTFAASSAAAPSRHGASLGSPGNPATLREPLAPVSARFLEGAPHMVAFGAFDPDDQLRRAGKISEVFIDFRGDRSPEVEIAIDVAAAHGQITLLTLEPRRTDDLTKAPTPEETNLLAAVAAGEEDATLLRFARVIAKSGQPVILRFAPEMDHGSDGLHPWSNSSPSTYIAAWNRVRSVFTSAGATNVRYLWSPGGYFDANGRFAADAWYPGDDVVDLVGFSAYMGLVWEQNGANGVYRTPEQLVLPRYDAISKHGKPVILPEVGIDLGNALREAQAPWLKSLLALAASDRMPLLVGLVYFNAPHNLPDYKLDWRLSRPDAAATLSEVLGIATFEMAPGGDPLARTFGHQASGALLMP